MSLNGDDRTPRPRGESLEIGPEEGRLTHRVANTPKADSGVEETNKSDNEKPLNRPAYFIIGLLGLGLLMSWNVVLLALDYLEEVHGKSIAFYVPLAYIIPQLPILVLMVWYGERFSYTIRIIATFLMLAVVLAVMPFLADITGPEGYGLTLFAIVLLGVATAVLQPSLFGFSAQFPGIYSQANMAGQGVAGILASAMRIITKASFPGATRESSIVFFSLAAFATLCCVAGFIYLLRMEITEYYLRRGQGHDDSEETRLLNSAGEPPTTPTRAVSDEKDSNGFHVPLQSPLLNHHDIVAARGGPTFDWDGEEGGERDVEGGAVAPSSHPLRKTAFQLAKETWSASLAVYMVFTVTFAVFPGETSKVEYRSTIGLHGLSKHDWWLVILLATFNVFDTIGRSAPAWINLFPYHGILIASLCRIVFIPLFVCGADPSLKFFNDIVNFVVMCLFAVTNGYTSTMGFIHGPLQVEPRYREKVGFLLGMFLQFGIFSGSMIALGVSRA